MSQPKYTFTVAIPIVGVRYATVVASSKEEAFDLAMDCDDSDDEFELVRHVVKGNVFYGPCREIEIVDQEPYVDADEEEVG